MTKELDTINELVGDALAGVRLTLTALRSIQAVVIEGNTVPAPPAELRRTRKPRSDKGKKRNPHTPVVRGTMVLSRKARAALAKRIRKPRGK